MRKLFTAICCISLAITGYFLAHNNGAATPTGSGTVAAANVLDWKIDGLNPSVTYIADGIVYDSIVHDTVTVTNTEYVMVKEPKHTTDTIYVPQFIANESIVGPVNNRSPGDRKEFTPDVLSPKPAEVVLFVDGEKVYSSENVITPTEPIIIDGLQEP